QLRVDLAVARRPEEAGRTVDHRLDVVPGARPEREEPEHDRRHCCLLHVAGRYILELGLSRTSRSVKDQTKAAAGTAALMRWRGLEPPRGINPTRPSTLRVYQFRHQRARRIVATVPWLLTRRRGGLCSPRLTEEPGDRS